MDKEYFKFFEDFQYSGFPNFNYIGSFQKEIKDNCFCDLLEFLSNFNQETFQKEFETFFKGNINYDYFKWIGLGITKVTKKEETQKFVVNYYNESIVEDPENSNSEIIKTEYLEKQLGLKEFSEYLILSYIISAFSDFFNKLKDCDEQQDVEKKFIIHSFQALSKCLEIIKNNIAIFNFCLATITHSLQKLKSQSFHFINKSDLFEFDPLLKFYFKIDKANVNEELGFNIKEQAENIYQKLLDQGYLEEKTNKEAFINVLSFQNTQDEIIYWIPDLKSFVAFFICLIKRVDLYYYYKNKSGKTRIRWEAFYESVLIKGKPFKSSSVKSTKTEVNKDNFLLKKF